MRGRAATRVGNRQREFRSLPNELFHQLTKAPIASIFEDGIAQLLLIIQIMGEYRGRPDAFSKT